MKPSFVATMALAIMALGGGRGAAQMNLAAPAVIGPTSPVGSGLGGFTADPQSMTLPYPNAVPSVPCASPNTSSPDLPTFDGGGMSRAANSVTPAAPGANGAATTPTLAPCISVSTAGVMSAAGSATSNPTGANASLPSTASWGSTGVAGSTGIGIASLGTGGLGTVGLGTAGLGPTGLGASASISASASQSRPPSTGVSGSPTFCSGASGGGSTYRMGSNTATSVATAAGASGVVRDLTQGVGSGLRDPAQTLAGEASLPTMNAAGAPCMMGE